MKKTLINIFKQYPILRKMNSAKKKIDKALPGERAQAQAAEEKVDQRESEVKDLKEKINDKE